MRSRRDFCIVPPWALSLTAAGIFTCTPGCVSVPAESAALSAELGVRLVELEKSHAAMLHQLMDERRRRVDEFIEHQWTPRFVTELNTDVAIAGLMRLASDANEDPADRQRAASLISTRIQEAVTRRRQVMLSPLDELERELERRLREEYATAVRLNDALTGLLASASQATAARDRLADRVGAGDIRDILNETDAIVGDLVAAGAAGEQAINAVDEQARAFIERVRDLVARIRATEGGITHAQ